MIIYKKRLFIFLLLAFVSAQWTPVSYAMNLLWPYDVFVRPVHHEGYCNNVYGMVEAGLGAATSYNHNGESSNALHLWQAKQDAVAMLLGFPLDSCVGQRIAQLQADELDLIARMGLSNFCGNLHVQASGAVGYFNYFANSFFVNAYLPFYSMRLSDVLIQGEDPTLTSLDVDTFKELVFELSDGLLLDGWHRTGLGNAALMVGWYHDFPQAKQVLKNVYISWYAALEFPTGLKANDDKLLAFSYGTEGAWAIPFGLGIELTLGTSFKVGIDAELKHTFDQTVDKRIKTNKCQTDLLLLQKTCVHQDFGLTQRFDLYVQWWRMCKGLSCMFGYEFYKHGDNFFALSSNNFSGDIANRARSLEDWTAHQIIITLSYDFQVHPQLTQYCLPNLELFTRLPFNGHRSVLTKTLGIGVSVEF